jgi:hypothetical protein
MGSLRRRGDGNFSREFLVRNTQSLGQLIDRILIPEALELLSDCCESFCRGSKALKYFKMSFNQRFSSRPSRNLKSIECPLPLHCYSCTPARVIANFSAFHLEITVRDMERCGKVPALRCASASGQSSNPESA